jgi:hypothetical protein
MAATEVIYFPLWVQLGPRLPFPYQTPFEYGRPFLLNLPPKCRCMLTLTRRVVAYSARKPYRMNRRSSTTTWSAAHGLRLRAEPERGDHHP